MELIHIPGVMPLCTNTFLLAQGKDAILVDAAANSKKYLDELAARGLTLRHILLTHGHYDHVGAVRALKEATGAKVWMDVADAAGDTLYPLQPADVDEGYTGAELNLGDFHFRIWHTPGHTRGSWCLLCGGNLFTGDTLFAGSCGRTDMPGGSMQQMMQSLSMLAELDLPPQTRILPGHEGFSTLEKEKQYNPYLSGMMF